MTRQMRCEAATTNDRCDNCGDPMVDWDWTPAYDRFCVGCLSKANDGWDYDPRADRGCHEFHQTR